MSGRAGVSVLQAVAEACHEFVVQASQTEHNGWLSLSGNLDQVPHLVRIADFRPVVIRPVRLDFMSSPKPTPCALMWGAKHRQLLVVQQVTVPRSMFRTPSVTRQRRALPYTTCAHYARLTATRVAPPDLTLSPIKSRR